MSAALNILVVDDVCSNRLALCLMLSKHGTCREAASGEEALEILEEEARGGHPVQLLCLDLLLSGISGAETLRRWRDREEEQKVPRERRIKVICVSTSDDPDDLAAVIVQHDVVHVPKPCTPAELRLAIVQLFSS